MISYAAIFLFALNASMPVPCEGLRELSFPDAKITVAELIPAGPFKTDGKMPQMGPAQPQMNLPAYCRVAAILTPSADSNIEMEAWLPIEGWNGKFQAVGNGGWAGMISYSAMASALQEGYATASTDTGHKGANSLFGIGHPEKVVDYAYRAVHEMTVKTKAIMKAFYGQDPRLSYWNGCSTGGRQGLMAAQRYPEDFDGIVAGAPANYHSHLHAADLATSVPHFKDTSAGVPASKLTLLNKAVIAACDGMDGVRDGLLTDPAKCKFDPSSLLCSSNSTENCLTASQLESVKRVYAPTKTKSGELIFPGKVPGSELGWSFIFGNQISPVGIGTFQLTYQDPNWDWRSFNKDRDTALADEKTGFINAVQPDLKAFKSRGGKLLLYHGWDDALISPGNTVNYYSSVLSAMGSEQGNWLRLFMMPGVGHCSGGTGPSQANFMSAMERWREAGEAPDHIEAYRVIGNTVDMTRPLCPYPEVARYKGIGSTNDAANFTCVAP
ncbi:MAG: tannase/feruloyl esterase family alpha/beta hydrolase [Acidobacteria bacterium]|nr:tannase/feruloyl esterase family alpha/beta hydrolase [Acidobacteriota bacterium]